MTEQRKKLTPSGFFLRKLRRVNRSPGSHGYDYPTTYFQEQAGVDMILVGAPRRTAAACRIISFIVTGKVLSGK
jgi:hypothetical protein